MILPSRKKISTSKKIFDRVIVAAFLTVVLAEVFSTLLVGSSITRHLNAPTKRQLAISPEASKKTNLWPESIGSCAQNGWPTEISLAIGSTPISMLAFEMDITTTGRLEVLISAVSHDEGLFPLGPLLQSVLPLLKCDFRTVGEAYNANQMPVYRSAVDMILLEEDRAQGFLAAKLTCPLLDLDELEGGYLLPTQAEASEMTPYQWGEAMKANWLHWQLVLLRNSSDSGSSNWLVAPSMPLCNTTVSIPPDADIYDWNVGPSVDDFRARGDEYERDKDVAPVNVSLCVVPLESESYQAWTESSILDWIYYQRSVLGFSTINYLDTHGEQLLIAQPELGSKEGFELVPHTAAYASMARLMSDGLVAQTLAKERCSMLARRQRVEYVFIVSNPMDLMVPMKRRRGYIGQALGRAVKNGCAGEMQVTSVPWNWPPDTFTAVGATLCSKGDRCLQRPLDMTSLYLTAESLSVGHFNTSSEKHSFFPAKASGWTTEGNCRGSNATFDSDLLLLKATAQSSTASRTLVVHQAPDASNPLQWQLDDVAAWAKHLLRINANTRDRMLVQRGDRPDYRGWMFTGRDTDPFAVRMCRPGADAGPLYGEMRVAMYDGSNKMLNRGPRLTIYNAEVDRGPTHDGPRVLRMSVFAEDEEAIRYTFYNDEAWGVLHQGPGAALLVPNITCVFSPMRRASGLSGSQQSVTSPGTWKSFADVLSWIECPLPEKIPAADAWSASSFVSLVAKQNARDEVSGSKVQIHTIRPLKICIGPEEKGGNLAAYNAQEHTCDNDSLACRIGCIDDGRSSADPQAKCCSRCHETHHRYMRFSERDIWTPTAAEKESGVRNRPLSTSGLPEISHNVTSILEGRDISICLRPFFMESACIECDGMQPLSIQRLIEWIEYHLLIGFDVIYVLDRFGHSLLPLLQPYIKSGRVIHVPFPLLTDTSLSVDGRSSKTKLIPSYHDQVMAYDFCMSLGRDRGDAYMALIDLDEFVRYQQLKAGSLRESVINVLTKHWNSNSSSVLPESIVLDRYDFKVQGEGFATGYTHRAKQKRVKTNGAGHGKFLVRPEAMVRGGPMVHEAYNASGSEDRVRFANPTGTNALLVPAEELVLFHYREEERRSWIPNPSKYAEQEMLEDLSLRWAYELLSTQFIGTGGWKAAIGLAKQGLLNLPRGRSRATTKMPIASDEEDGRPTLFIGVLSYCAGRDRRDAVRQTWLSKEVLESQASHIRIEVKFVLGKTPKQEKSSWCTSRALRSEVSKFGDILFLDVDESYQVLTRKSLEMFHWANRHLNPHFVFKTDDDSYINLPSLVGALLQVEDPDLPMYLGTHHAQAIPVWLTTSPDAAGDGRWYIKPEDLPIDAQSYALGAGYILSRPLVQHIVSLPSHHGNAQLPWNPETRMGWLEDAAVGMLLRGVANRGNRVNGLDVLDVWNPSRCTSEFGLSLFHHLNAAQMVELHRVLSATNSSIPGGVCRQVGNLLKRFRTQVQAADPQKRATATEFGGSILDQPSSQVLNLSPPPFKGFRSGMLSGDAVPLDLPYGRDVLVVTGGCHNIGHELIRTIHEGFSKITGPITILLIDITVDTPECDFPKWAQAPSLDVRIRKARVDITEYSSLYNTLKAFAPRIRGVVHLAAISRVQYCQSDIQRCKAVNVGGTENMLRAMSELYQPPETFDSERVTSPLPWLLFASSREVYGALSRDEVASETSPLRPLNPYGATKLDAELEIRKWTRKTGFNAIAVRFTNVYGSCFDHKTRLVPAISSRLLAGKNIVVFGSDDKTISLLHVEDAVQSLLLGIKFASSVLDNAAGVYEAINIGGGPNHDALGIMEIVEVTGSSVMKSVNHTNVRTGDWRRLISVARDTAGRAPEPDHFRSSVSKAFRVLGYSPSRTFNEETVTAFVTKCHSDNNRPRSTYGVASGNHPRSSEESSVGDDIEDEKVNVFLLDVYFLNVGVSTFLVLIFWLRLVNRVVTESGANILRNGLHPRGWTHRSD